MNKKFLINLPNFEVCLLTFIVIYLLYISVINNPKCKLSQNIKSTFTNKKEDFEISDQFPKTLNETKTLIDQMVVHETTTYVVGEEGNHDYPLSSAFCSETYNSNPSSRNEYELNLNSRDYKNTYAVGEEGTPITKVLTVHSQEEGTPFLCPKINDGGLGRFK
tara:strand:+ start:153 stop:641 length:489 start_codon:yes stop_codon:yes gene_type:complete